MLIFMQDLIVEYVEHAMTKSVQLGKKWKKVCFIVYFNLQLVIINIRGNLLSCAANPEFSGNV